MSIQSEITRIETAVADTTQTISDMGGNVSAVSSIDDLPNAVSTIPTGIKSLTVNNSTYTPNSSGNVNIGVFPTGVSVRYGTSSVPSGVGVAGDIYFQII